MLRIFLIIAIVAGIAATALTITKVQDIIVNTRAERDSWHQKDDKEVADHKQTKKTLNETQATLATTKKDLEQTKSDLVAAKGQVEDLTAKNKDLSDKSDKAIAERDEAQAQLERWRALGKSVEQIKDMESELVKKRNAEQVLIKENKALASEATDWKDRYLAMVNPDEAVMLPPGLRGKIVSVDPKFNFVVLNIGSDQGVRQRGEMMVDRNGKLLGKVKISSVSKTECVANILPGWKQRGEIMEGDEVLY